MFCASVIFKAKWLEIKLKIYIENTVAFKKRTFYF